MPRNIINRVRQFEVNAQPSQTIPNQAFTLSELLRRHSVGLLTDLDVGREGIWQDNMDHDSPDLEQLNRMDHASRYEYIEALRLQTDDLKHQLKQRKEWHGQQSQAQPQVSAPESSAP